MIIFLYGPDSYRRLQKQKEITSQYKNKHSSLTIDKFDLDEDGEDSRLKDFIESRSLFDSYKLAVISNLLIYETNRITDNNLYDIVSRYIGTKEVALLVSEANEPKKEWKFLLEKPVISQQFDNLTTEQFKKFISGEAGKRNLILKQEILNSLANQHEGDTWGLITELDKLALLASHSPPPASQLRYDFFSLINKLSRGGFSERLKALEILLNKEDSAKVFNVLAYSGNKKKFAEYDLAVKSGKLDYETALLDFAIS